MDITDLKKAEEALRLSEEKANALVKYAPTGIYEIDYRNPKFKNVNDAMCKILGYTREELLAMSPADVLDADSGLRFKERVMNLLAGKKIDDTVEFKVKTKDGRTIYTVLNVMFTYKDGKPDNAVVIAHDVTERKKAMEALQRQAALIDLSPDAIIVKELGDTITFWSEGAEKLYGYSKAEAIDRNASVLLSAKYPEPLKNIMTHLAKNGRWSGDVIHQTKIGTEVVVQSWWLIKKDELGKREIFRVKHGRYGT